MKHWLAERKYDIMHHYFNSDKDKIIANGGKLTSRIGQWWKNVTLATFIYLLWIN